jgi:DNA-binding CsgD family transcriptional regulator
LNLSLATVRSQLQAAMHKTSTSRQTELLSLILSIPVCRPDHDKAF